MAKTAYTRMVGYMLKHKSVTFQAIAKQSGVSVDAVYDIINHRAVKSKVEAKVVAWLKEHKKDHPKVRYP